MGLLGQVQQLPPPLLHRLHDPIGGAIDAAAAATTTTATSPRELADLGAHARAGPRQQPRSPPQPPHRRVRFQQLGRAGARRLVADAVAAVVRFLRRLLRLLGPAVLERL